MSGRLVSGSFSAISAKVNSLIKERASLRARSVLGEAASCSYTLLSNSLYASFTVGFSVEARQDCPEMLLIGEKPVCKE
jgi:hypothetical protein